MRLEMKTRCERCGEDLPQAGDAYICSYECTFCKTCAADLNSVCPNCGGELIRRPKRIASVPTPELDDSTATTAPRTWLVWAVSFAVWGFITLAATFTIDEFYRARGAPMTFLETLGSESAQILPYALLTPFAFFLALRYKIRKNNWLRISFLHLSAGVIFCLLHVAMRQSTHYGYWDSKTRTWHSAFWDSQDKKFYVNWNVIDSMVLGSIVDDISGAYLPIVLCAYMVEFYRSSRVRERRASELAAQLSKANLQALKAQLQPHFLFNTMNSISALMLTDVTAADRMMSRFSDLLRMTLEDGAGHVTTLSRELEFVSGYLEIEKVRFGDRLSVTIDFAPDTLDAEVPHLLLQPLVENAVRHGIAKLSSKGEIRMTSRREGNSLHLIVSDNGPGFVSPGEPRLNGGVGLRATLERLNTLYGDTQSLRIRNGRDGGAEISVLIPFRPVLQQA